MIPKHGASEVLWLQRGVEKHVGAGQTLPKHMEVEQALPEHVGVEQTLPGAVPGTRAWHQPRGVTTAKNQNQNHQPDRGKSSPKRGMESPVSQRWEEVSKEGKEDVGMIPLGIKHSWRLRRGLHLSPLNLSPWNLPERQELSLGELPWIPPVKVPQMSWRKASAVRVKAWQSSWMEGERQRVENTWREQVWPQAQTGNAGTALDPHLGLLVPPLSLWRRKTRIPHTCLGIKPLSLRRMKVGKSLGEGKPLSHTHLGMLLCFWRSGSWIADLIPFSFYSVEKQKC